MAIKQNKEGYKTKPHRKVNVACYHKKSDVVEEQGVIFPAGARVYPAGNLE